MHFLGTGKLRPAAGDPPYNSRKETGAELRFDPGSASCCLFNGLVKDLLLNIQVLVKVHKVALRRRG